MSLLFLVRHGQAALGAYVQSASAESAAHSATDSAESDPGRLTELGRRQALLTANALAARGQWPDRIIAGTPARQRETGEALRAAWGTDAPALETDDRWDEYDGSALLAAYPPSSGPEPGQSKSRFFQQVLDESLGRWMADPLPSARPSGLPPWSEFTERSRQAVADLSAGLGRGGTAIVATSAGVISSVVAGLLGLTPENLVGIHRIVVNASVTSVILGSRANHLLTFNEHGHLQQVGTELVTYR